MSYNNPWYLNGEVFEPVSLKGLEGFVYLITNIYSNRKYVGKKSFWQRRKGKGGTRRRTQESDWKDYYGSSIPLQEEIKASSPNNYKREILHLCKNKIQMSYHEMREQVLREVIFTDEYYNESVVGKFYPRHIDGQITPCLLSELPRSNEAKAKKKQNMTGENNPAKRPEVRAKLGRRGELNHRYGKKNTKEQTNAIINACKGKSFMNNGKDCKRIDPIDFDYYLSIGWRFGRRTIARQKIITCPHCGKTGGASGMHTWHFDKCKFKI